MHEKADIRPVFMVAQRVELAERLVGDLLHNGIQQQGVSVFAGRAGLLGLPEGVSLFVVRRPAAAAWRGGVVGAALGLAVGLGVWTLAGALAVAAAVVALGALLGTLAAMLINSRYRRGTLGPLRQVVDAGDLVVRVRVPKDRLSQVEARVKSHHPEIQVRGVDPGGSPPFP